MIKSNFYTTLYLPGCKKNIRVNEINNFYYLDILKFIQNNDISDLNHFLDKVIKENTDADINELSNVDKFCILVEMRSISIGNIIEFFIDNTHIKYNLSDICKNIQNLELKSTEIEFCGIPIIIDMPRNFIFNENEDILFQCITTVGDLNLNIVNESEKKLIYSALPAHVYSDIKKFITDTSDFFDQKNIFSILNIDSFKNFKLNPFNTTFIEFLKSIYNDSLTNFYDLQFSLITKLNISYEHFMSMTFNESRMYVALQNKEIKKQEESQKKSGGNLAL
jgi:hypothetical protein